ncbi:MAG TPA: PilZ domain-containing protein, partial [Myxococcaceae bacterium]|nr:PilZ domain-containing protein [Myxococcaceae bacterium]
RNGRGAERAVPIRDRAWCAALLRSALRSGGVLLQPLDDSRLGIHCTAGQVTGASVEFTVSPGAHPFSEYEVVRGRFEIGGGVYRFYSSVMARSPLRLRLPVAIEEIQKRSAPRYQLSAGQPVTVRLSSQLLSAPAVRQVRDLGGTGFSFELDTAVDVFPPGMSFHQIELRIGEEEIRCQGQVKNLARIPNAPGKLRCGVEFDHLEESARVRLADLIMRSRFPSLDDGRSVPFDELWSFFLQTKFLYPQKQQRLAPLLPELRRTLEQLNSRPTKIFKSVVICKGSRIVGYISALRAYENTWLSQHLAAAQGGQAGRLLNFGMVEFQQNVDLEYFKIFYRPENRWPARVFETFARNISDPNLSDLRTYGYFTLETDGTHIPVDAAIEVFEASERELRIVERRFVEREHGLLLKSDDLTCNALRLSELNQRFEKLGLFRRRRVLLAVHEHEPVGFALAELSSPGLNLSELLSAFSIHLLPGASTRAAAVRNSLLRAVLGVYRNAGRPFAVALVQPDELAQYQAFGARTLKQYRCWTCHRSMYMRYCDHVDRLLQTLMDRQYSRTAAKGVRGEALTLLHAVNVPAGRMPVS